MKILRANHMTVVTVSYYRIKAGRNKSGQPLYNTDVAFYFVVAS